MSKDKYMFFLYKQEKLRSIADTILDHNFVFLFLGPLGLGQLLDNFLSWAVSVEENV